MAVREQQVDLACLSCSRTSVPFFSICMRPKCHLQVSGLATGASNSQLASCSWDGCVRLWDCEQHLVCTAMLTGHYGAAHAVVWEQAGSLVMSAGQVGLAVLSCPWAGSSSKWHRCSLQRCEGEAKPLANVKGSCRSCHGISLLVLSAAGSRLRSSCKGHVAP